MDIPEAKSKAPQEQQRQDWQELPQSPQWNSETQPSRAPAWQHQLRVFQELAEQLAGPQVPQRAMGASVLCSINPPDPSPNKKLDEAKRRLLKASPLSNM